MRLEYVIFLVTKGRKNIGLKKPLFTNIQLEETIKMCCESLDKNQELCNISKNQFEKLLRAALSNNYFLFDGIIYPQVDGLAMDFPLDPRLANAFLAHYQ